MVDIFLSSMILLTFIFKPSDTYVCVEVSSEKIVNKICGIVIEDHLIKLCEIVEMVTSHMNGYIISCVF